MDPQQLSTQMPYGGAGPSPLGPSHRGSDLHGPDLDDELIPTAIVIKNIPFAIRKEQLVELMTQMNLPLPYAFNYHFDNGVFRGLAFANFTSADETAIVIENLNHYDLQGRRLRVEYKKMLPLQERERIEREKRERRGQLEEQHRPVGGQLQNHPSMSSLASHRPATTPSPIGTRQEMPGMSSSRSPMFRMLTTSCSDLNDPETLQFYNQLFMFKEDFSREALIFPSSLTPAQRRVVHTIAHHMQLQHLSRGNGEQRQLHVFRPNRPSPPLGGMPPIHGGDSSRRALNRAATIDFNEARSAEQGNYGVLRGQQSSGLLGIPDSPGGFGTNQNLRAAKSVADLRSYTPSPVPSSASFSQNLASNISRFQDYGPSSGASGTPTITPTAPGVPLGQQRDDSLVNGFSGMSLRGANGDSPRRLRPVFSWDQESQQPSNGPSNAGAIGSNRSFSMNNNYDNSARDRGVPLRQPHGPSERGHSAFSRGRQNGHQARGSDELRQQSNVEIIVE